MHYKGIIFDLDGTLGDTLPSTYKAFQDVFKKHLGMEYTDQDIHGMFGPCERGILQRRLGDTWEQGFQEYLELYEAHPEVCTEPFAGIRAALDWLHTRGVRMAIVTGKSDASGHISLRLLGLDHYFSILEGGDACGNVKPEKIRDILRRWDMSPRHAAYIGDSPSDIPAARKAGVTALAAAWAPAAPVDHLIQADPDAIFYETGQFLTWLQENVAQPGSGSQKGSTIHG